jgi:chromatin remodeling complex protein RSC6
MHHGSTHDGGFLASLGMTGDSGAASTFDVDVCCESSAESANLIGRGRITMATTKKASGSKGGGKGLAAEVQPSADLAPIVGSKPIPRSEVTKKVWDYIKAHGLQDQTNRRMINADDHLKKIFNGKKQVSMFEMTALVNKHLS